MQRASLRAFVFAAVRLRREAGRRPHATAGFRCGFDFAGDHNGGSDTNDGNHRRYRTDNGNNNDRAGDSNHCTDNHRCRANNDNCGTDNNRSGNHTPGNHQSRRNDPCRGNHGADHRSTYDASRPDNDDSTQNNRRTDDYPAADAVLHDFNRLQNAA